MMYLKLFHGRNDPARDMDDWGFDGPIFGPYQFIHTTYANFVKMSDTDGKMNELHIVGPDMIYYNGSYYGDWSVYENPEGSLIEKFNYKKATPPKFPKRLAKIIVYIKGGICQDVKTNIPEELWDYAIVDYDHVPFSENEMEPLFL